MSADVSSPTSDADVSSPTSDAGFLYACGCAAEKVGQHFERGVLVCPDHKEPVAVGPAASRAWRGHCTVTYALVAADHEEAALIADRVERGLLDLDAVSGVVSSLQETDA